MGKNLEPLKVTCPCCKAKMSVDPALGVVLSHEEPPRKGPDVDLTNAAGILSEQQRFVLERRWEVEQEEIRKQQALETAQIQKQIVIIEEASQREAADVRSALSSPQENPSFIAQNERM